MAFTEVILPGDQLGDELDADVSELVVEEGATVGPGQVIMLLESAKVVLEISAPVGGRVHFVVGTGAVVDVGQVLATIEG